ncbi:hypothetical protein Pint_35740 [Pistacia integerrima]|uniref:Uncharacterized protein n=1 Tax=Pistacia integerrima TaxID=434235 RepID=A0ACC0Y303_9ROSI|nr:hypothetical protein Pint_35740 [Pistacia integerrima]
MYSVKTISPEGIPEVPKFHRCFLGFAAQKKRFIKSCRHFIGVDGCHLKDPYGGVLLSAVSMDANGEGIDPITFMSDRQKGLVDVVQACWPNARTMNDVRAVDENAYRWMIDNEVTSWSRHAFDLESKSDHVTNSMCEVFNSWLGDNRELPILSLLELYKRRIMKRMQARAKCGADWVIAIPPVIHKKINSLFEVARSVDVIWPGSEEFEVKDNNILPRRGVANKILSIAKSKREDKLHPLKQVKRVKVQVKCLAIVKDDRLYWVCLGCVFGGNGEEVRCVLDVFSSGNGEEVKEKK